MSFDRVDNNSGHLGRPILDVQFWTRGAFLEQIDLQLLSILRFGSKLEPICLVLWQLLIAMCQFWLQHLKVYNAAVAKYCEPAVAKYSAAWYVKS